MPIVLPKPFLFHSGTNKFRIGRNSMKFCPLLIFSMALLKTLPMPVQAQASEESLMVSQNNANGSQKFQLKV